MKEEIKISAWQISSLSWFKTSLFSWWLNVEITMTISFVFQLNIGHYYGIAQHVKDILYNAFCFTNPHCVKILLVSRPALPNASHHVQFIFITLKWSPSITVLQEVAHRSVSKKTSSNCELSFCIALLLGL